MPGNLPLNALLVLSVFLWGCTANGSLRPDVNLRVDHPVPNTVQAWGYPRPNGADGDADYYSLGVNLTAAPSFRFTFADGYRADSRSINAAILTEHLGKVELDENGRLVSRVSISEGSKRYVVVFSVGANGLATNLWLYACNVNKTNLLGTSDGSKWFAFPITQRGINELFGSPVITGRDFTIFGSACDSYVP